MRSWEGADQEYEDLVNGDWVGSADNLWELLTGLILDTRTPLERMAVVTRNLKAAKYGESNLLDFRVLHEIAQTTGAEHVANLLKIAGYPWYNQKSRFFEAVPEFDLGTASFEQMQTILGVGPKLASLWRNIVHGEQLPVIDAHVYRWLGKLGYKIPLAKYAELAAVVTEEAKARGVSVSALDQLLVENGIRKRKGMETLPVPERRSKTSNRKVALQ